MKKFEAGFIGAGNMGGALATAAAKQVTGERVAVACSSPAHSAAAAERLGCRAAAPEEILGGSKFVFLGVKPQMIDGVVQSLAAPIAASESIIVSMLAGVQLERLERLLGADKKIIRILPNTACAVGQGVVLYCANGNVTDGDLAAFCALMAAAGIVDPISEALIDAGCAITGCGPRVCVYVHRGAGRRRRQMRPAARKSHPLRSADARRQRGDGVAVRQAPGAAQGRGLQPRRQHDRRRRRARAARFSRQLHRGRGRRV